MRERSVNTACPTDQTPIDRVTLDRDAQGVLTDRLGGRVRCRVSRNCTPDPIPREQVGDLAGELLGD
jgi:hypothetical protein